MCSFSGLIFKINTCRSVIELAYINGRRSFDGWCGLDLALLFAPFTNYRNHIICHAVTYLFPNFDSTFCKQTDETMIRRRPLCRLILVCTVCKCPNKRIQCVYRLLERVSSGRDDSQQFEVFWAGVLLRIISCLKKGSKSL